MIGEMQWCGARPPVSGDYQVASAFASLTSNPGQLHPVFILVFVPLTCCPTFASWTTGAVGALRRPCRPDFRGADKALQRSVHDGSYIQRWPCVLLKLKPSLHTSAGTARVCLLRSRTPLLPCCVCGRSLSSGYHFAELVALFPDDYFHVGGDEIKALGPCGVLHRRRARQPRHARLPPRMHWPSSPRAPHLMHKGCAGHRQLE